MVAPLNRTSLHRLPIALPQFIFFHFLSSLHDHPRFSQYPILPSTSSVMSRSDLLTSIAIEMPLPFGDSIVIPVYIMRHSGWLNTNHDVPNFPSFFPSPHDFLRHSEKNKLIGETAIARQNMEIASCFTSIVLFDLNCRKMICLREYQG